MRVTELAAGLVLGCALGFAAHEWMGPDTAGGTDGAAPLAARPPPAGESPRRGGATASVPATEALEARPAPAGVPAAADPAIAGATADALVGILVHGAVIDTDDKPVPHGARPWLYFDDGRGAPVTMELGQASTYATSGLQPGELTIRTDQQGFRPYRQAITLSAERPVVRHDIVLQPAVVLLVKAFTPSGEPLSAAVVRELGRGDEWSAPRLSAVATREAPAGDLPEISHRGYERWGIGNYGDRLDGRWNGTNDLPLDVMGRLELDESLPAFVSLVFRHVLVATQRVEPGAQEVVFTVPLASLQGLLGTVRLRVEDASTSKVPEGVKAELSDSQSSGPGITPDDTGTFAWEKQRPGLLELSIHAPGYETWEQDVSVPASGTADLGTIGLTPATKIAGLVVDGSGKPVVVSLRALRDDLGVGLGMGERRETESDLEGRFEAAGLGRHRYRIVISSKSLAAPPVFVDARNGDVDGVRVVVEPGALLRVRTLWSAGESYGVRVTSADGVVFSSTDRWQGDWTWSKRLPTGDYTAALLREGKVLTQVPVTLGSEGASVDLQP
jgi:hypothetical protein